jgi:hypothetical protein
MTNTAPGSKAREEVQVEARLCRKRSSEKMNFKFLVKLRRRQLEKQRLRFGVSRVELSKLFRQDVTKRKGRVVE